MPPCAPAGRTDGGTASQLIRRVGRTRVRDELRAAVFRVVCPVLACGFVCAATMAEETRPITVEASVMVFGGKPGSYSWRGVLHPSGILQGKVGDSPFSSTTVSAGALARVRALANCLVATPDPEFQGVPIMDPPPPEVSTLRVRVGSSSREIELCDPSQEPPVTMAKRRSAGVALELLIALRDLVPREAYDYRGEFRKAQTGSALCGSQLPAPTARIGMRGVAQQRCHRTPKPGQ